MEMTFKIGNYPLKTRLTLFALAAFLGVFSQVIFLASGAGMAPAVSVGVFIIILGYIPIFAKHYTNKPKDLGFEDWQPASEREVNRIASNFSLTRKLKVPQYFNPGFGIFAFLVLSGLGTFLFIIDSPLSGLLFVDAAFLLIPFLFFGAIMIFVPKQLEMKMRSFSVILDATRPENIKITPYLRLDKDPEGRNIPEDIRLMIEPKRKPSNFMGAQVQIAINNGPNGAVPYMYAVFLTEGTGQIYKKLSNMDFGRFIVEPQSDGDYGTIVIRQQTSGTGYHTQPDDCRELYQTVLKTLERISL
ncbi:MAG: hypothetical protein ACLFR1_04310 [Spirochaetia bacterium]